LRILFQKFVRPEWATTFHWEKWKEPHLNFPEELVQYGDNDETWLPVVDRDNFRDSLKGLKSMELFEKYFTKLREEVRKKHYSIRTEQTYENWLARFITFHGHKDSLLKLPSGVETSTW